MKKNLLFIILFFLLLIILLPSFIIPVKISCQTQYGDCPSEVSDKIAYLNGKKINYAKKHLKKDLESNFLVSAYTTQFRLPNVLRANMVIKNPEFALGNKISGNFGLIDKEGTVLALSAKTQLPTVITNENLPEVGLQVDAKTLLALYLVYGLNKMYQISTGNIETDTLLVDIPGGLRVIFPLVDSDRDLLLGTFKLIYSNIKNADGEFLYSEIDLRYENPVLR